MRKRWFWVGLMAGGLLTLIAAGIAIARGALGAPEQLTAATVGDAFSYQGELIRGTTLVSDTCQMTFSLYDAADGGMQVGETITAPVIVIDGRFTVLLDFGGDAFNGEARWLGIAVKCSDDPSFVSFPERQELTAAPYALYARTAGTAPWEGLTDLPPDFADGTDDVIDADSDAGNELNQAMALIGNTLVLTDTVQVAADLSGLRIRQLIQDLVMHSGESVSAGDLVTWMDGDAYGSSPRWSEKSVFQSSAVDGIAVTALSDTEFIVVYRDGANNNYGTAVVGTIEDGIISWGTPDAFSDARANYLAVIAVSPNEIVIAYSDDGNSGYGTTIAGAPTSTGFLWGPESIFNTALTWNIALVALSPTQVVAAYTDGGNSNHGTAIAGTLDSGTVTWDTASVFNPDFTVDIAAVEMSATDLVIAYVDNGTPSYGTVISGTLDGGTLSWGSESVYSHANTGSVDVVALSPTRIVVGYGDYANSGRATVIAGTLDADDISWETPSPVPGSPAYGARVSALSDSKLAVVYRGEGSAGTGVIGDVTGGQIIWSRAGVFNVDDVGSLDVTVMPGVDFVVAYSDQTIGNLGTARLANRMARRMIGVAQGAAGGGETVAVLLYGVDGLQSGLTPGQVYYWQDDGSLSPTPTLNRVGLALSSTELLLDHLWPQ